jgi:hypothetical protein
MNILLLPHKELLFKNEVLRAQLSIRDFYLNHAVKEIFENIGQVLSVVQMQLNLNYNNKPGTGEGTNSPGYLVGQTIRDLRTMSKSFYADTDIIKQEGFTGAFETTLAVLYGVIKPVIEKGIRKEILPGLKLIAFKIMQDILISTHEAAGEFISLTINYKDDHAELILCYNGKPIVLDEGGADIGTDADLTIQQRVQLINGRFNVTQSKAGITRVKLITPLNISFYE